MCIDSLTEDPIFGVFELMNCQKFALMVLMRSRWRPSISDGAHEVVMTDIHVMMFMRKYSIVSSIGTFCVFSEYCMRLHL